MSRVYVGRVKDQSFIILAGIRESISYLGDVTEAKDINGELVGYSYYKYYDFGKLKTARMISIKYQHRAIWVSYPKPYGCSLDLRNTHIHTQSEIDKLLASYNYKG